MVYMPGFDLIDRPSLMAYEWDGVKPTWLCENGVEVIDLTFVMGTHGYVDFLGKKQTCMLNMPKKVC